MSLLGDGDSQLGGLPSTPSGEYFYDDFFNRMTQMTDGIGSTTYTYHPVDGATSGAGLVHEINGPLADDTLTFAYDELGRRSKRQINGTANEETDAYDRTGRLETIVNPLGQFDYEYVNPTARLAKLIRRSGAQRQPVLQSEPGLVNGVQGFSCGFDQGDETERGGAGPYRTSGRTRRPAASQGRAMGRTAPSVRDRDEDRSHRTAPAEVRTREGTAGVQDEVSHRCAKRLACPAARDGNPR